MPLLVASAVTCLSRSQQALRRRCAVRRPEQADVRLQQVPGQRRGEMTGSERTVVQG